jgi:hypothetical protein
MTHVEAPSELKKRNAPTKCLNLNRNSCIMLSNIAGHKVRLIF